MSRLSLNVEDACSAHQIFNEALLCAREWADTLLTRILCVPIGKVGHGHFILASWARASFLFKCFIWSALQQYPGLQRLTNLGEILNLLLVHSPGSLLGSADWLPGRNCWFLSVVSHLLAFLQSWEGQSGKDTGCLDSNIPTGYVLGMFSTPWELLWSSLAHFPGLVS